MKLTGRQAIVTGGNDGLGLETVKKLVSRGCRVIMLGKDEKKVRNAADSIDSKLVQTIVCDIRNQGQVHNKLKSAGIPDILINCAGIIDYSPLDKQDPDKIKDIVETNLLGTIYVTQEVIGEMKKRNEGIILNVSSTSGLPTGGHANESAYMASKYGVYGFTEALKKEIQAEKLKVKIAGFYPGGMNTRIFAKGGEEKDTSKFMDPAEIAEIIIFLLERPDNLSIDHIVINRNKNA